MMLKQKMNVFMVWILLVSIVSSGFQTQVFAADIANSGTITVAGSEMADVLLPETHVTYGENETALDVLVNTVGAANIDIDNTQYGKSIKRIKGLTKTNPFYWAFYVNGIFAQVNYDAYIVKPGDKLSFVYTDWNKAPEKTVMIKVSGKDGKDLFKPLNNVAFIGQPTAFQLLQSAAGSENVGYHQYDFGKMVTSINGVQAQGTDYWGFNVNGKMASVGPDSYQLQNGDEISFSYITSAPSTDTNGSIDDNKTPIPPLSAGVLNKSVESVMQYALKHRIGEWEAIALKQAGKSIPASYLENIKKLVAEKKGKFAKITDYERYALGILAAGGNPSNIGGYNLIASIYNGDVTKQGLNGVAYGLIVLDSSNFKVPSKAKWTKKKLVNQLLSKQNKDGGWAWDGNASSDADSTAMVLTALAPHKSEVGVQAKIDRAVQFLSLKFLAGKIDNSSTAAQAVIALSALKIDANSSLFSKDEKSLMAYLLTFQNADGGFDWQGGNVSDPFSTAQGIQAVTAYKLLVNGKGSIYAIPLTPSAKATQRPIAESAITHKNKSMVQGGHLLPNTATNDLNLVTGGLLLVVIGVAYFYFANRKRA